MKPYLVLLFFFFFSSFLIAQHTVVVAGGNGTGVGSVSYTVGQIFVNTNVGDNGTVSEGIQQSIELFTLTNPELTTLDLKAITYPNPTKDKIVLSLKDTALKNLSFVLYDLNGRVMKKGKVLGERTAIPMKTFASGMYLLRVLQNSNPLKVFKIIKN